MNPKEGEHYKESRGEDLTALSEVELEARAAQARREREESQKVMASAETQDAPAINAARKALEDSHAWDDSDQQRRGFN